MVLVNGADGIATGWSVHVPNHNPLDIIQIVRSNIRKTLEASTTEVNSGSTENAPAVSIEEPRPWYRGFYGSIIQIRDHSDGTDRYFIRGKVSYNATRQEVRITELPVGVWTQKVKVQIEKMIRGRGTNGSNDLEVNEDRDSKRKAKTKPGVVVESFSENHTDTTVDFTIKVSRQSAPLLSTEAKIHEAFGLNKYVSYANMHCINTDGVIVKYER